MLDDIPCDIRYGESICTERGRDQLFNEKSLIVSIHYKSKRGRVARLARPRFSDTFPGDPRGRRRGHLDGVYRRAEKEQQAGTVISAMGLTTSSRLKRVVT